MPEQPHTAEIHFDLPQHVDMIALERRARELRAKVFADGVRAAFRWVVRRVAAERTPTGSRTA